MVAVVYPDPRAIIVEDNNDFVSYPILSAWTLGFDPELYTGLSYHLTYVQGATVEFTFTGTEVWFYADKNDDHGSFSARIDDGRPTVVNGFSSVLQTQVQLFTAKVPPGRHKLTLTNLDNNRALGIDYFAFIPVNPDTPFPTDVPASTAGNSPTTIFSPSASHSHTMTPPITPNTAPPVIEVSSNSNKLPTGAVVGVALGTVGIVIFIALGFIILRDRRKQRAQRTKSFDSGGGGTTADPWIYNHPPPSPFLSPFRGSPEFNFGAQAPTPRSGKGGMMFPMENLEGDLDGRRPQSLYSIEPPDSDVVQPSGAGGAGGYAAGASGIHDPRYFYRSDYSPSSNAPTRSGW